MKSFQYHYACFVLAAAFQIGCYPASLENARNVNQLSLQIESARDQRDMDTLISALSSGTTTRRWASLALIALGPDAVPALMRAVRDPAVVGNASQFAQVAQVLADIGDRPALEFLAGSSITIDDKETIVLQKADTSQYAIRKYGANDASPPSIFYSYWALKSWKENVTQEELEAIPITVEMRLRFGKNLRIVKEAALACWTVYYELGPGGSRDYTIAERDAHESALRSALPSIRKNYPLYSGGGLYAVDVTLEVPYSIDLSAYARDRLAKGGPSAYALMIQRSHPVPPRSPARN
jgi:hypothetical protein